MHVYKSAREVRKDGTIQENNEMRSMRSMRMNGDIMGKILRRDAVHTITNSMSVSRGIVSIHSDDIN